MARLVAWAWAEVSGRSMSGLSAMLLENALHQALRDGDVPVEALRAMQRYQAAQAERVALMLRRCSRCSRRFDSLNSCTMASASVRSSFDEVALSAS